MPEIGKADHDMSMLNTTLSPSESNKSHVYKTYLYKRADMDGLHDDMIRTLKQTCRSALSPNSQRL